MTSKPEQLEALGYSVKEYYLGKDIYMCRTTETKRPLKTTYVMEHDLREFDVVILLTYTSINGDIYM